MANLPEFLLARIAEDEAAARKATAGPWLWDREPDMDDDPGVLVSATATEPWPGAPGQVWPVTVLHASGTDEWELVIADPDAVHIARWDPARVLAEAEVKRRIVEIHKPWYGSYECPTCADGAGLDHGEVVVERLPAPCPTLRLLASVYASHPDYREEWAVTSPAGSR